MKKLIVIAIVLGSIAFSSCRRFNLLTKEYTCDCHVEGYEEWYDWTAEYSKSDAEEACDATSSAVANYLEGSSCELL